MVVASLVTGAIVALVDSTINVDFRASVEKLASKLVIQSALYVVFCYWEVV